MCITLRKTILNTKSRATRPIISRPTKAARLNVHPSKGTVWSPHFDWPFQPKLDGVRDRNEPTANTEVRRTHRWRRQSGANSSLWPNFPASWGEIHRFCSPRSEYPIESAMGIKDLQTKFPTQPNKEIISPEQGIKSAHQGSLPSDQGSPERFGSPSLADHMT